MMSRTEKLLEELVEHLSMLQGKDLYSKVYEKKEMSPDGMDKPDVPDEIEAGGVASKGQMGQEEMKEASHFKKKPKIDMKGTGDDEDEMSDEEIEEMLKGLC